MTEPLAHPASKSLQVTVAGTRKAITVRFCTDEGLPFLRFAPVVFSAVDQFKRQFAHLEENYNKKESGSKEKGSSGKGNSSPLERQHASLPKERVGDYRKEAAKYSGDSGAVKGATFTGKTGHPGMGAKPGQPIQSKPAASNGAVQVNQWSEHSFLGRQRCTHCIDLLPGILRQLFVTFSPFRACFLLCSNQPAIDGLLGGQASIHAVKKDKAEIDRALVVGALQFCSLAYDQSRTSSAVLLIVAGQVHKERIHWGFEVLRPKQKHGSNRGFGSG